MSKNTEKHPLDYCPKIRPLVDAPKLLWLLICIGCLIVAVLSAFSVIVVIVVRQDLSSISPPARSWGELAKPLLIYVGATLISTSAAMLAWRKHTSD